LFSAGKKLFALYLAHAGMANSFGAAGSLAVLLMWLYFSAVVLLLGAEFSAARARVHDPRGAWGQLNEAPPGSRAKMASVFAASTMPAHPQGHPVQPAGGVSGTASAEGTSPASSSVMASRAAAGRQRAAFTLQRFTRAPGGQGTPGAFGDSVGTAAKLGRKVIKAEGQATRAAAAGLIVAGRKAAAADRYVKRHAWGSVLMAAGAALVLTAIAGRMRSNGDADPQPPDDHS
jgi:membrane protein